MTLDEFKSYWRSLPGTENDHDLLIESNYESGYYGVWSSRLSDKFLNADDITVYVKNLELNELRELIKINMLFYKLEQIQEDF